ncbi:MAG: sugar phosphate isomerase/epimerase [Ectothiorhodospiraceae bacterium]|nr:sugar phosphate isomerase/epimerase [Chromatiales bacterium]MCP5154899.1 sugar phosphate isomerase/epimerase [Ectothiorhodospiraceae bacterium]
MSAELHARFALNTYSYTLHGTIGDHLPAFAAAGFRELELMMYPGHLWPLDMGAAEQAALRRTVEGLGLRVRTLNQPNIDINVTAASPEMRRYSLDVLRSVVTLAGELGAEGVVIGPGKANPLLPAPMERLVGWSFAALDELLPHAESCGTRLLMENMPFAFLPDVEGMMSALERYGADQIGVVYDVANAHFIGEDLTAGFARVGSRLHTVHLSDTNRTAYRHARVGAGDVDFAHALAAARAVGHRRPAVLEIICDDPADAIPDSARRLAELGWDSIGD